LFPAAILRYKT